MIRGVQRLFLSATVTSTPTSITSAVGGLLRLRSNPHLLRSAKRNYSIFTIVAEMAKELTPKSLTPLIIAGPSGVGKSTLIKRLMTEYPNNFGFSVSHTTRKPRDGEVDGVHYFFTTLDNFEKLKQENAFIETAKYAANFYGTSKQAVKSVADQNKICILDVDIQGILSLKQTDLGCRFFFVKPPSLEELERRLANRGEPESNIVLRIDQAKKELPYTETDKHPNFFDAIIVNDDLDTAYKDLLAAVSTL